jgi:hypothetical protein
MWAGIATAVLGGGGDDSLRDAAEGVLSSLDKAASALPEDGLGRLVGLIRLSNYRTHQSIFGSTVDSEILVAENARILPPNINSPSDFIKVMSRADPSQDALPGFSTRQVIASDAGNSSNQIRPGWCSPVTDAFRGVLEDGSAGPEVSIIGAMRDLAMSKTATEIQVTEFDAALDQAVVAMLLADQSPEPMLGAQARNAVLGWYSDYLTRLLGIHMGIGARIRTVAEYVNNWIEAGNGELASETHDNLLQLILPTFGNSEGISKRLVGLFRPRTEAIIHRTSAPQLVVDIKGIHLTAVASGDSVLLTLARRAGQKFHQLLTINLDADLLAETGLNSKNQQGLSERTESVTPMIERFRASAADAGVWAVVDGERVSTLR